MSSSLGIPREYIAPGLALSLLLHLLSISALVTYKVPPPALAPTIINVSLEDLTPPKLKQIVSVPDRGEALSPANGYQSDKDNTVPKEMIRRGIDPNAGKSPLPPARASTAKKEPQSKTASPKEIKTLKLDDAYVSKKFADGAEKSKPQQSRSDPLSDYQPFSRAAGDGAAIFGEAGMPDYLPNLPDGDVTMLNTKANQFAVFVRRVATKVFAHIRQSGWDSLRAGDIAAIQGYSTVEAVLSLKGELLTVELLSSSGSRRYDDVIIAAVKNAAQDQNPPPAAAASDGKIHFIFKSQSWSRGAVNRRGFPYERRWLLLGTGLL